MISYGAVLESAVVEVAGMIPIDLSSRERRKVDIRSVVATRVMKEDARAVAIRQYQESWESETWGS